MSLGLARVLHFRKRPDPPPEGYRARFGGHGDKTKSQGRTGNVTDYVDLRFVKEFEDSRLIKNLIRKQPLHCGMTKARRG